MIKTNEIVDELMNFPRANRSRVREIIKVVWRHGFEKGRKREKNIKNRDYRNTIARLKKNIYKEFKNIKSVK